MHLQRCTPQRPFSSKGAADIVLQTSYFAFMNRFNDAMKTPSEDLALQDYREIYGADWQALTPRHADTRVER